MLRTGSDSTEKDDSITIDYYQSIVKSTYTSMYLLSFFKLNIHTLTDFNLLFYQIFSPLLPSIAILTII